MSLAYLIVVLLLIYTAESKNIPCPKVLTLDLSGATIYENYLTKDGLRFDRKNYFDEDGTFYGCVCNIKPCIRKCCDKDEVMVNEKCTKAYNNFTLEVGVYNRDIPSNLSTHLFVIYNSMNYCDYGKKQILLSSRRGEFDVQTNGYLFLPHDPDPIRNTEDYCVETHYYNSGKWSNGKYDIDTKAHLCHVGENTAKSHGQPSRLTIIFIAVICVTNLTTILLLLVRKVDIFIDIFLLLKKMYLNVRPTNFEMGALKRLNSKLTAVHQAEFLQYDVKWEFPRDKLILGEQLGSGAFGVVVKAVAKGINEVKGPITVAVKMVKENSDPNQVKALASELKIMMHLGKQLNVVNLLGACTKNVVNGEILVIVEYCRFGNLQSYLLRNRKNFIDQIDPQTGYVDYKIGQDVFGNYNSFGNTASFSNPPMSCLKSAQLSNSHCDRNEGQDTVCGSHCTIDMNSTSVVPPSVAADRNNIHDVSPSHQQDDLNYNINYICTKDLLAWAFQVSRGMEYLVSRKVLHGDLAARNILLSKDNVVKISNFGLARRIIKDHYKMNKNNVLLPTKWMAVEAIRDRIFSIQSDVWSFGVVLWEFFSLGRTPYPNMEIVERFYDKLFDGYSMESPEYAPPEIYKIMLDCWQKNPRMRPSFADLPERIGSVLGDPFRQNYIRMNDIYTMINAQGLEDGHNDLLAMMHPPDFESLSSP